eukprot:TRINITY_DN3317_c0_g1_i3.p2 TRINITY_DN3317_c0_g1~~TRINITY_DN3317_c0_g1_i3.p2  ORF type:complete len:116 (-),score=25.86 TRINITY_DN3317_c0_g1_i3:52-399(-)
MCIRDSCQIVDLYKQGRLFALLDKYKFDIDGRKREEISQILDTIPNVSFRASLLNYDSEKCQVIEPEKKDEFKIDNPNARPKLDYPKEFEEGVEACVRVHLKKEDPEQSLSLIHI